MSAMAEGWTAPQSRSRIILPVTWWSAAAAGGLAGGFLPHPLAAAALAAALVGLLQALSFRPDLRYGATWFGASAIAGALGFAAMIVGGNAFSQIAGADPGLLRQGLAAWIGLGALGGLLLAAAQAPLTGRPGLALGWCAIGFLGGGVLWPVGFAIGYRFGPELATLTEHVPQLAARPDLLKQALGFGLAWLLHALPFGLLVGSRSDER